MGVKDSIETCAAWYIVYVELTYLTQSFLQVFGSLNLFTTNFGVIVEMTTHFACIAIIGFDFVQQFLVGYFFCTQHWCGCACER